MKPNVFTNSPFCAEDYFSNSLAYILNLFPAIGDRLLERIAVLAGKTPGYFGPFRTCEFVAYEFPDGHRQSRPDLKFVGARRLLYLENKLDAPLSIAQIQRHADLVGRIRGSRLIFVSNVAHISPKLREIPGYLHPQGRDHYLWVDLMLALLDVRHRSGSVTATLLGDFNEALKLNGIVGRSLAGASGSLYTDGSPASHLALNELGVVLRDIGYRVMRNPRERTLRAYPLALGRYPLLNPRFRCTASWLDKSLDFECIEITVFSRGRGPNRSVRGHLSRFPSQRACTFVPWSLQSSDPDSYSCAGHFVLRVRFTRGRDGYSIDWATVRAPLAALLSFLQRPS